MQIKIESHPNLNMRTYRSVGATLLGDWDQVLAQAVALSESSQLHSFVAPLPKQPTEVDFRQFRLMGSRGEMLAQELCQIAGVTRVSVGPEHVSVVIRNHARMAWFDVEQQLSLAFKKVFPGEKEFVWTEVTTAA